MQTPKVKLAKQTKDMFDSVSQIQTGSKIGYESQLENTYISNVNQQKEQHNESFSLAVSEGISDMQLLRSICMEMIKLEKGIEVERDYLATQSDVQLDQVFLMFANSLSDRISAAELNDRGRQVGVSCLNDATLLLKRFDSDEDGYLTFWEFANVLLPRDQYRSKQVQKRK